MQTSQPRARFSPAARDAIREWAGPALLATVWTVFYVWRALRAHAALQTNAYDLSLFDYTLWTTLHGHPGFVPFMHSIFSHHFLPIVVLMAPVYALWPAPEWLIVIQTAALAAGGLLFFALARDLGLGRTAALALMLVLLISRRGHSAAVGYFYFESLQPGLMFALVLAWRRERWRAFWIATALLLTTKEDMPLYLAAFAAIAAVVTPAYRRRAGILAVIAAAWLFFAFVIAIPAARHLEGLGTANPFFEARFGAVGAGASGAETLLGRLVSHPALGALFSLLAAAGFLSLAAPRWLLVAAPAILLCLSLAPGSPQAAMMGHYALPILPWVFVSAAEGVARLQRWSPAIASALLVLLVAGTLADAPALREGGLNTVDPEAVVVLQQLPPLEGTVLAVQPNLIPHVPHSFAIRGLDETVLAGRPDEVLLTEIGDLWPYSPAEVRALIGRFQSDPGYEQVVGGPLYVFRRRPALRRP